MLKYILIIVIFGIMFLVFLFLYSQYFGRGIRWNYSSDIIYMTGNSDGLEIRSNIGIYNSIWSDSDISYNINGNDIYLSAYARLYKFYKKSDINKIKISLKTGKYNVYYKNNIIDSVFIGQIDIK